MLIGRHRAGITFFALVPALAASWAFAQGASPWVDPPEDLGAAQEQQEAPPADATSSVGAPLPLPPIRPPAEPSTSREAARTTPAPATEDARSRDSAASGAEPTTGSVRARPDELPRVPSVAEQPGNAHENAQSALAEAARALAVDYLGTWSSPNAMTPNAISRFYAATVRFHGRVMSARALLNEKRRFVQRWPERNYQHRQDSLEVSCDPDAATCTVRSVFDFEAANPRRRRHSEGVAALDLTVSFKGERPVIIAESSEVLARAPAGRDLEMGGQFDD
jgi:hypothetical protein